jgi:hypothetical protein
MSDQLGNRDTNAAGDEPPPATTAPVGAPAPHRHRILIGTLSVLATIIGIVAVLAMWANRQALNTDNWTNTSSRVSDARLSQFGKPFHSTGSRSTPAAGSPRRLRAGTGRADYEAWLATGMDRGSYVG